MSQKKTLERERNRSDLRNRLSRLSMVPSSRRSSRHSSMQPQPRPSSTSSTSKRSQKITEGSIESIDHKLDEILTRQKRLEEQVSNLRELLCVPSFNTKDKNFINRFVVEIAQQTLCNYIYPTKSEFLEETEDFLSVEQPAFFNSFSKKEWHMFFEENIYKNLVAKHRSQRGILTSKIKDAMFYVFSDKKLARISTSDSPSDIAKWKRSIKLKECYKILHEPMDLMDNDSDTYIMCIVEKVFEKKATDTQIAYTTSVCEYLLDPDNDSIQITESLIRDKFEEALEELQRNSSDENNFEEEVINEGHGLFNEEVRKGVETEVALEEKQRNENAALSKDGVEEKDRGSGESGGKDEEERGEGSGGKKNEKDGETDGSVSSSDEEKEPLEKRGRKEEVKGKNAKRVRSEERVSNNEGRKKKRK